MKIGIDARLIEETGVGRYIRNLLGELARADSHNEYMVFLRKKSFDSFVLPNSRWQKVLAEVPWHTVTEQVVMPGIFGRAHLDLLHVPYFNVPIFYRGPFIVTVHDLTILHFDTGKASTHAWIFYKVRRWGYRIIVRWGILHAKHLIAVSKATRQEILDHFPISAEKVTVTYEGVDEKLMSQTGEKKPLIAGPYFLYVGNAYPHKNLETLLAGFVKLKDNAKLVLVGKDDFFYTRLRKTVDAMGLATRVVFFGQANNAQLVNLYTNAKALVFPSLMEGFGLPALEALALGTPVICSDIPVFREILNGDAVFFDPKDPDDIAKKLREPADRTSIAGIKRIQSYSWKKMADVTKQIYERSTGL